MDNDEVDLWASDEVHLQQHGSRCRMLVPPETKDPCDGKHDLIEFLLSRQSFSAALQVALRFHD
jgi:hypothetical protein